MSTNKNSNEIEDILYFTRDPRDPLLKGAYTELVVRNFVDKTTNYNRTVAKLVAKDLSIINLTSDGIVQLIGQEKYNFIFKILRTRNDKSLSLKAIISLLTQPNANSIPNKLSILEKLRVILKCKTLDEVLSNADNLIEHAETCPITRNKEKLKSLYFALPSIDDSDGVKDAASNQYYEKSTIVYALDGSKIFLPYKPKDVFHLTSPDIFKYTTDEERKKLQCLQTAYDWKLCSEKNEYGYLPLHIAISKSDIKLAKRHSAMWIAKKIPIDTPVNDLTPIQMAILSNKSADIMINLLYKGADVMQMNKKEQNLMHLAASTNYELLSAFISTIMTLSRKLCYLEIQSSTNMSEKQYAKRIIAELAETSDIYGDTPLMVACRAGSVANIEALVKHAPETVDLINPTSGNTALHIAIITAGQYYRDSTNAARINEIKKIISIMIKLCNTFIKNHNNMSVIDLLHYINNKELTAFTTHELSMKSIGHKIRIPSTPISTYIPGQKNTNSLLISNQPSQSPARFTIVKNKATYTKTNNSSKAKKMVTFPLNRKIVKILPTGSLAGSSINNETLRKIIAIPTQRLQPVRSQGNLTTQNSLAAQSGFILVSDERNNIAGTLTRVNIIKAPAQLLKNDANKISPTLGNNEFPNLPKIVSISSCKNIGTDNEKVRPVIIRNDVLAKTINPNSKSNQSGLDKVASDDNENITTTKKKIIILKRKPKQDIKIKSKIVKIC